MTREEAIKSLMRCEAETHCRHYTETFRCDGCNKRKALDMAIKALMAIEALQEQNRGCMWVCPNCGLEVHIDYDECVRCGERRK